jgi:hypothetical protein
MGLGAHCLSSASDREVPKQVKSSDAKTLRTQCLPLIRVNRLGVGQPFLRETTGRGG